MGHVKFPCKKSLKNFHLCDSIPLNLSRALGEGIVDPRLEFIKS